MQKKLNLQKHFHLSHILFLVFIIIGFFYRNQMQNALEATTDSFVKNFDWFVLLSISFFLGLCIYLAFGKYGNIRLGDDNQKPKFTTSSWLGMLFAAGTGNGLIFHGVAEPIYHIEHLKNAMPLEMIHENPTNLAMRMTMTHWGLHAWSIYAIFALIIAYFGFRHKYALLPSVPFIHKYGLKKNGIVSHSINFMAIVAITFGLTGALVQGIQQVTTGIISLGFNAYTQEYLNIIIMIVFLCVIPYLLCWGFIEALKF